MEQNERKKQELIKVRKQRYELEKQLKEDGKFSYDFMHFSYLLQREIQITLCLMEAKNGQ